MKRIVMFTGGVLLALVASAGWFIGAITFVLVDWFFGLVCLLIGLSAMAGSAVCFARGLTAEGEAHSILRRGRQRHLFLRACAILTLIEAVILIVVVFLSVRKIALPLNGGDGAVALFASFYAIAAILIWLLAGKPVRRVRAVSAAEPAAPRARVDWHDRLLASLRDCGVQRVRRNALPQWILTIIVVIIVAVVARLGAAILADGFPASATEARTAVGVVWTILMIFVFVRIRNRFLRKAWQSVARNAEKELMHDSSRRPILYLRSFQLDERIGRPTWPERFLGSPPMANMEQALTQVLRKHGPVIAIGRPDESLPPLGAARLYVSHDRWQEKVVDVTSACRYVVWATGVTEGLRWEISHLLENVPAEKVILWAHPHLLRADTAQREAEWTHFRGALGGLFPHSLPKTLGDARFIYFTSDWQPRPVAPPRDLMSFARSIVNPQGAALRAVLAVKDGKKAESAVAYSAAADRNVPRGFGELIGTAGTAIHWSRLLVFFAACVAYQLPTLWNDVGRFFTSGLWSASLLTAAAAMAFRFIPDAFGAATTAALIVAVVKLGSGEGAFLRFLDTFAATFVLLLGLDIALRRIPRLVPALMVGAVGAWSVAWLLGRWISPIDVPWQTETVFPEALRPVLFLTVLLIGVRKTPAP